MPQERSISATLERQLYLQGIELFNEHEYFEAHEAWEEAWRATTGRRRRFYHGLIQCTVALEHYRRGNARGVISLAHSYPPKLEGLPDVYRGLDLARFGREMAEILRPVLQADPPPPQGAIVLDLSACPRIELLYDPFEAGGRAGDE